MATFHLRRFSQPAMLRKIAPQHLINFFRPYANYLAARGITLPDATDGHALPYEAISVVLLHPDSNTPPEMAEALYYINEMSTPEGFDLIQDAIAGTDIDGRIGEESAYGDLALQVWMQDPHNYRAPARRAVFIPPACI